MNKYAVTAVALLIVAGVALSISYRFAIAGRPDSLWLWRDVLGVVP